MKSDEKKSQYLLNSEQESLRLKAQNQNHNYDPVKELPKDCLQLKGNEKILDAGCGNAVLSKLILGYYPGMPLIIDAVDNSPHQIKNLKRELPEIRGKFPSCKMKCHNFDLQKIAKPSDYYDLILSRNVYQHIPHIINSVSEELYRVLRPGGLFILTDVDGVFYGLECEDKFVNQCISKIKENLPFFEGYICKKIPRTLINAGFKVEHPRHILASFFNEEDRKHEHAMWKMRLQQIRPHLEKILGESKFEKFQDAYLREVLSPLNFVYCNKFIFFARKSA